MKKLKFQLLILITVLSTLLQPVAAQDIWGSMANTIPAKGYEGIYKIEGRIDADATQISFGALVTLNGKFYYDNLVIEIETEKNKWSTIYSADFENGMAGWTKGKNVVNSNEGKNELLKASIVTDEVLKSKCLLIETKGISNN